MWGGGGGFDVKGEIFEGDVVRRAFFYWLISIDGQVCVNH